MNCVVCIPARNEEEALPHLLAALAAQDMGPPLRVVIVANNCTDRTAEAARGFTDPRLDIRIHEPALSPGRSNVGVARGLAMAAGADWLRDEAPDGILVSTDADATPPPHWLRATGRAFAAGAEIVGGEIRIAAEDTLPGWLRQTRARVADYWSAVRELAQQIDPVPHDPSPHHGDHTGASLAVTVDAYEASGGVPPLPSGEDLALVNAVERNGGRVRHPPEVWTEVSAREQGRADGGMALEMQTWRRIARTGEAHLLPDALSWHRHFTCRRVLRDGYRNGLPPSVAAAVDLPRAWLAAIARESVNDIAFVACCEPLLHKSPARLAEIGRATRELQALALSDAA